MKSSESRIYAALAPAKRGAMPPEGGTQSEKQNLTKLLLTCLVAFEADDVLDFDRDSAVKEMHDRMIVGVARRLNAPLLTKDANITASGLVSIVW